MTQLDLDALPRTEFGETLNIASADQSRLLYLATRRSTPMALMGGPGPTRTELNVILKIAARVPDHGKLAPWRFILILEEARAKLGDALAEQRPSATEEEKAIIKKTFLRAPSVVCVVSSLKDHPKIPAWEQELSAGAVCYNALLAAQSLGFSATWLTETVAYDQQAGLLLGLKSRERVAGFIHIGTATDKPKERERPDLSNLVTEWTA